MRTLVTGGAGFIGSHLVEELVAAGDHVIALDDLSTGSSANLAALAGHPRFELVRGSAADERLVRELAAASERVFHLAAVVGMRLVLAAPERALERNVESSSVVLRAAAEHGLPTLFASSSEVYGAAEVAPFREEHAALLGPRGGRRWAYACSKALGEWLALGWARERGLPLVTARLFNVAGPRQVETQGMVLATFVAAALAGEPLTVHGDGRQTRSFAHVREVAQALVRLLACARAGRPEVVNVGSDEELAIGALAECVRDVAGSSSTIVHRPYREVFGAGFEDVRRRVPCLARLETLTGARPRLPIRAIVEDAVRWRRERLRAGEGSPIRGDAEPTAARRSPPRAPRAVG